MSGGRSVRRLFSLLVYLNAASIGTGLFVLTPARPLVIVPLVTVGVLLSHAVKTAELDALGYAILWLWAAILALFVGSVVIEQLILSHRDIRPLAEIPAVRVVGTGGLLTVLVTAYIRGVRGASQEGQQDTLVP